MYAARLAILSGPQIGGGGWFTFVMARRQGEILAAALREGLVPAVLVAVVQAVFRSSSMLGAMLC